MYFCLLKIEEERRMIIRFRKAAGILALACVICSCENRQTRYLLKDVETYIQEAPDSALTVLETIRPGDLNTPSLKADYSLLYAAALDKNYVDTTDLEILVPALDYYSSKGPDDKLMRTWYYWGRMHYNAEDYSNALLAYSNALKYVGNDVFYLGLINSAMADVYNITFNKAEELVYAEESLKYFEEYGDANHIALAKYKLAQASFNNKLFAQADSIYASVYTGTDSTSVVSIYSILGQVQNDLFCGNPNYERDLSLLNYVLTVNGALSEEEYYEYVYCLFQLGEKDLANEFLEALDELPENKETFGWKYRIEVLNGNIESALKYYEVFGEYQDSIVSELLSSSVFKAQTNYYKTSAQISWQKEQLSKQKIIILVFVVLFLLLLLIGIAILFKRRAQHNRTIILQAIEEIEKLSQVNATLQNRNLQNEDRINKLHQSYLTLYQKQFGEIIKYYNVTPSRNEEVMTEKTERTLINEVKGLLKEISSRSSQLVLEGKINEDLYNIVSRIRQDFPKYKDEDIRFICYVLLGFDTSTIAFLMNISKENVRVKRHRFHLKLSNYTGPNESVYQMFLK